MENELEKEKIELEQEETKRFKVFVNTRKNNETGEDFNVYKALTKQGKIDLKFTKDVDKEKLPTHTCFLKVKKSHVNINQKFEYPVMWVSEIDSLEEIQFTQNVDDYLD